MTPTSFRRVAAVLLALLLPLAAVLRPAPASAHANLVQSDPPAQAVLARTPARIQMSFSEAVSPADIEVTVLDASRRQVDRGDAALLSGTDDAVTISLNDGLPSGVYTVQWKMVSAVDGHITRGLLPFTVGDPGALPPAGAAESEASSGGMPGVVARWLTLLAAVVLTGTFAFVPLMLAPGLRLLDGFAVPAARAGKQVDDTVTAGTTKQVEALALRRLLRIAWFALAVFAVAVVLLLIVETATAKDIGYFNTLGRPLWDRLTETRRGAEWLIRAGLITLIGAGLALVAWDARRHARAAIGRSWSWAALAVLGAGTLLVQSLGSHAAALRTGEALATGIDWLHLLAVALWIGGLVQFGLAVLPALAPLGGPPRTRLLAGLIPRFSLVAGASVGLIVLTGIYQTVRLLDGWSAFTKESWGQTLLVKLALFVALLALAGINLLILRPRLAGLAGRMDRPAREVAARVRFHFRRALLGEVGVAVLVLLVVGVLTGNSPSEATGQATGPVRPIILPGAAEDLKGRMLISPGRIGLNRFDLTVTDRDGRPPSNDTQVVLRISTTDQDTGTAEVKSEALGGGRFTAAGSYLSTIGFWEVAALVRRPGADEVRIPFQFRLSDISGRVEVRENRPAAPLERGRELFQNNCVQCHGAGARGDGPLAQALTPRPLDLTVHVPLHSDQELHDWIANGVPRTSMPAWKDQFSDEEIQAIINYLRQVAEQTQQER